MGRKGGGKEAGQLRKLADILLTHFPPFRNFCLWTTFAYGATDMLLSLQTLNSAREDSPFKYIARLMVAILHSAPGSFIMQAGCRFIQCEPATCLHYEWTRCTMQNCHHQSRDVYLNGESSRAELRVCKERSMSVVP